VASTNLLTPASLLVAHWLRMVSGETLFAVVAVPSSRVVSTSNANTAASSARQLIQFGIEATLARVPIALAGWCLDESAFVWVQLVVWWPSWLFGWLVVVIVNRCFDSQQLISRAGWKRVA